jgi:ubiquinone/menaquinone biosynthesis C-methylase UbiE
MDDLIFACPRCSALLSPTLSCRECDSKFDCQDGIYRFLLPESELDLEPSLAQYRRVRELEGNVGRASDYYRALPFVPPQNPESDRWYIRQQSYRCLLSLLPKAPATILDLGAGNCWLTSRLSVLGHRCVAVDISLDAEDGLGAHIHYDVEFTCVKADFDALPFAPGQFDVLIFNAALHYSPNIELSLARANRILKPGGKIFVIDSPTFQTGQAGRQMLDRQDEDFRKRFNLPQVICRGVGYIARLQMSEAGFQFHRSRGRFLWELRRLWSGIKLQREPAAFGVWEGAPR